jgi:hypothetical protein
MEMSKLSQEILQQLDNCADDFQFPMLDNGYVYLADTRMSVYASPSNWAIIIEVLGYNPRAWKTDGFDNCLYCFGNFLGCKIGTDNANFLFPISDGMSAPLFAENEPEIINEFARDVKIRENLFPITNDLNAYARSGIILEAPPSVHAFEFLRLLAITYRDLLLATEAELRARVIGDIPLMLQINEWHHPDIVIGEKPSQNETFILIAEMIDKLDTSIYHSSKSPNTHWSNWKDGGTL